ncbi:DUF1284 domain-containing protein [Daeguia caeni]
MLSYRGNGYSPEFVQNFDVIAERLNNRETIRLVDGPDDICAPLCRGGASSSGHCHNESVTRRDRLALAAISPLLGRTLQSGTEMVLDGRQLALLRRAFAEGAIRKACHGCEWFDLCTTTAAENFAHTRINDHPRDRVVNACKPCAS